MTASRKEQVISVGFILFSIVLLILSSQLRGKGVAAIGPGFMPSVIAVVLLILSLSNLIIHTKKQISGNERPEDTPNRHPMEPAAYIRLGATILLLFVYVVFLTTIGFPVMTFLYLFFQFLLFSRKVSLRTVVKDLVLAAVSSAVITLIFYRLLNLFLPMGIWY